MSKTLIINKLNKCKPYEYYQNLKTFEDTTSIVSTSTKTQQSPPVTQLNPQFTFKAINLKQILPPKPKAQQFFENFDWNNHVIYEKVKLTKPKILERSLEFELMNLFREGQKNNEENTAIKKLDFCDDEKSERKISCPSGIEIRKSTQPLINYMKTQFTQMCELENKKNTQFFDDNVPYDSKKYKLQRQRQYPNKQPYIRPMNKRCHTQVGHYQPIQSYILQNHQQANRKLSTNFNKFDCKKDLDEGKHDFFNNYYFNDEPYLSQQMKQNEKNSEINGLGYNRKHNNSSRLSFFRKQREHQMRKSLLENYGKSFKRNAFYSNQNRENTNYGKKLLPSMHLRNLSQAGQKRIKNQSSERYLIEKKYKQQRQTEGKIPNHPPKTNYTYLNKERQTRIESIRKQLKQIYQLKNQEKMKLKLTRDQEINQQNSKNSLRRVGSICNF